MLEEADLTGDGSRVAASALCEEGARLHDQAEYDAARARYERALAMLDEETPKDLAQAARCLNGLGRVLTKLGDDANAEEALQRALSIQERVLEAGHADRAATLHDLGELRANRGQREAGMALLREALAIRQRALGPDHPDTLESIILLALLVSQGGDHVQAEQMLAGALAHCERALGEQHLTTARVLNALGRLWARNESTHSRALDAYKRALATYEKLLGPDHPWLALVLNNLAALRADRKEYEAARPLLERSLAIHERVYGADNWRTSFVLANLADTFSHEGDRAAARRLLERVLVIRERAWGPEHPETVRALRKLVSILGSLQKAGDESAKREGLALFPCLTALEAAAGKSDLADQGLPGTHLDPAQAAARLHDLAGRLAADLARPPLTDAERAQIETVHELARQADGDYAAGDYAAAIAHLEQALRVQRDVLGEFHMDHVELLRRLAEVLPHAGKYSAVLPIVERIVEIHFQVLGPVHPMTTAAIGHLRQQIEYEYGPAAARPLQEQMLASMEANVGAGDPLVAMARQSAERLRARVNEAEAGWPDGPSRSERREAALGAVSSTEHDILDGLDAVDWHSLKHCYGPADDVPDLMRLLLADDEQVRRDAWEELSNNLWHQGDVYQATSYAVPFLLRMLRAESVPDKSYILGFLLGIANGVPYLTEHHTWMEEVLSKEGRDFQAEIKLARDYVQEAHDAVAAGLEIYLDLLDDRDPGAREWSFALLSALPEHAGRAVPVLLAHLQAEPEPDLKARLIEHLGSGLTGLLPGEEEGPVAELLERLVQSGETGMVRFAAAVALSSALGEETPPAAIQVLEHALVHPAGLYALPGREPAEPGWRKRLVVQEACSALARVAIGRRIAALLRGLSKVSEPEDAHQAAILLLDSALLGLARTARYTGTPEATEEAISFGVTGPRGGDGVQTRVYPQAETPLDAASLTPLQRRAVQAVLNSPAVWELPSNLLEAYGLPASPAKARDLVR